VIFCWLICVHPGIQVMGDHLGVMQMIYPAAEGMFGVSQEAALDRSLAEALRQHQIDGTCQNKYKSNHNTE
jgi:hypothetical protein